MDYTLIGTAAKSQLCSAFFQNEWSFHKDIEMRKDLTEALISKHLLICKAGITPDGLSGFFLDAAGKFRKGLHLIQRVTSGECDVGELISLDDFEKFIYGHFPAAHEIP